MFYLFPAELLLRTEFWDFPRNPHVVFDTPKWRKLYHSDKFIETIPMPFIIGGAVLVVGIIVSVVVIVSSEKKKKQRR